MSGGGLGKELGERAEALREELDGLLLDLGSAEGSVRTALGRAAHALARFCELGPTDDGIAALGDLRAATASARDALPPARAEGDGPLLDEAIAWIDDLKRRALDALAPPESLAERAAKLDLVEPFVASVGTPAVHVPFVVPPPEVLERRRPFLAPPIEVEPTPALAPSPAARELARLGRDAMEDVAILGGLRRAKDEEVWSHAAAFEARLLANLDALWSLDRPVRADAPRLGVPAALFAYASEWSFPDWGRAFAFAFSLGCTRSEAALRWVVLAMRRADPGNFDGYVAGLAAASGPAIGRVALAEIGADAGAAHASAWLAIAERKRAFDAGVLVPLLAHPDPEVRLRAALCHRHGPRELAVEAWLDLLDDASPRVAVVAADELAAVGRAEGLARARLVLADAIRTAEQTDTDAPPPEEGLVALRAIALAGLPADEELVLRASRVAPAWLVYLGWFGRPAHVGGLLDALGAARDRGPAGRALAEAAEHAITRITGLAAEAPVPELRAAVVQLAEDAPAYQSARRARHGRPYEAASVVDELAHRNTAQGVRRVLARELCVALPAASRFDVDDWVASQKAQIVLLRTMLPSTGT